MNLYIVSTPIGNLQDITLRAATILLETKIIIAESTSKAGLLLSFIEREFDKKRLLDQKIISLTEDEEENKIPHILNFLETDDAALISEAGTPLISDPGFKLVREAISHGVTIIPIPGATAVMAALSVSGFPTDKFLFLGFLSKSASKKEKTFADLKLVPFKQTIILYESPQRLIETLKSINSVLGDIDIVIARELTKIHEEIRRERISVSIDHFRANAPRGEFTILFISGS